MHSNKKIKANAFCILHTLNCRHRELFENHPFKGYFVQNHDFVGTLELLKCFNFCRIYC